MLISETEYCQVAIKSRQNNVLFVSAITLLFYSVAQALTIVFPVCMSKLGFTPTLIGLVMSCSGFIMIFARPIAGRMVDRYGPMITLYPVLILYPIIICGLFSSSIYVLAITRTFMGLFVSFFAAAIMNLFITRYPDEKKGNGFSIFSALTILPTIYSSFLSLLCLSTLGKTNFLIVILFVALINIVFAMKLNSYREGLSVIAEHAHNSNDKKYPWIFVSACMMIFCLSIINGAIYTFLPLFLSGDNFKLAGLYFFIQAVTLFSCRLLFRKRIINSEERVAAFIFILTICSSIATFLLSTKPAVIFLILSAILNGVAFAFYYPVLATLVSNRLPKESASYYLGIYTSCADLGLAVGAIIMGVIAEIYSYHFMYVICSILGVFSGALFFLILKRRDKVATYQLTSL